MFFEFGEKCPVIIFGTGCPEVKGTDLAQDLLLALCFFGILLWIRKNRAGALPSLSSPKCSWITFLSPTLYVKSGCHVTPGHSNSAPSLYGSSYLNSTPCT